MEPSGLVEMFSLMIGVAFTQVYAVFQTHLTVPVQPKHFTGRVIL